MQKYEVVPYRDNHSGIPDILQKHERDDIKVKEILQKLHSLLHPTTTLSTRDVATETAPSTREEQSQTAPVYVDDRKLIAYVSKSYRHKALSLFNLLRPVLSWYDRTLHALINGVPQKDANITDFVSRAKIPPVPSYLIAFYHSLRN